MENCPKCGGTNINVTFEPYGEYRAYARSIEGVEKFMRNDTYYYEDMVKKEHLIYKCQTCGYRKADNCKDNGGAS